jgi:hypothetical protein
MVMTSIARAILVAIFSYCFLYMLYEWFLHYSVATLYIWALRNSGRAAATSTRGSTMWKIDAVRGSDLTIWKYNYFSVNRFTVPVVEFSHMTITQGFCNSLS